MTIAIALVLTGFVLAYSALKGLSLTDVFSGVTGESLSPKGGRGGGNTAGGEVAANSPGSDAAQAASTTGLRPKGIIDNVVIPLAQRRGIKVDAASVAAANGRHGPTITGGRSDHQGPPEIAWAADLPGTTSQMDAVANDLAQMFGIEWDGSGLAEVTKDGVRYQLIYRTMVGGNHFTHVHFGARKA